MGKGVQILKLTKSISYAAIRSILPPRCPVTGEVTLAPGAVSPSVWQKLDFIEQPFCSRCGVRFDVPVEHDTLCPRCVVEPPIYDRARSALAYDDTSRAMILSFKHGDRTVLVQTFLPWLLRAGEGMQNDAHMIVPVPLHWRRLVARRYNQAGLLAQALARAWQKPYRPDVLIRKKAIPSQGRMTRAQRFDNVRGAFDVPVSRAADIAGRTIVLIDDVMTTGATVEESARVLKQAGAGRVDILTLARVIRPEHLDS